MSDADVEAVLHEGWQQPPGYANGAAALVGSNKLVSHAATSAVAL